jgi:hypothetical protein
MKQNQKRNKQSIWKIIQKEERPQRNSWFDEEHQIILEDEKITYNTMINRNTR